MAQRPHTSLAIAPLQRLGLSPTLATGMQMLALPSTDLAAHLEALAQENPLLLVEVPLAERVGDLTAAARTATEGENLTDSLRRQLACSSLASKVRDLAELLAADLDQKGYLPESDDDIARSLGVLPEIVAEARLALQACEPAGVAARDFADCLRLQLVDQGYEPERAELICTQVRVLARGDYVAASAELGGTVADMIELASHLASLSPAPASRADESQARHLVPEIEIFIGYDGRPRARLVEDVLPSVSLDRTLFARLSQSLGSPGQASVSPGFNCDAAQRVVAGVEFRYRTLLRIGEVIADRQAPFFLGRAVAPGPLNRADVASRIGMHSATVGRAVRGTALTFSGRSYLLSDFFPSALKSSDGDDVSSAEAQAHIRAVIAAETPQSVFSDEELAERLQDLGVDIARRTVTKYRKCMQIPSKALRRRRLVLRARRSRAEAL